MMKWIMKHRPKAAFFIGQDTKYIMKIGNNRVWLHFPSIDLKAEDDPTEFDFDRHAEGDIGFIIDNMYLPEFGMEKMASIGWGDVILSDNYTNGALVRNLSTGEQLLEIDQANELKLLAWLIKKYPEGRASNNVLIDNIVGPSNWSVSDQIVDKMKDFVRDNDNAEATRLFIPRDIEQALRKEFPDRFVHNPDPMAALKSGMPDRPAEMYGMKVVWDADGLKCDAPQPDKDVDV
jgi:hypothetical protein